MSSLSDTEQLGEIAAIRAKLKSDTAKYDGFNQAVVSYFSSKNIEIDPSIKSKLILALPEELSENLNGVILPGGTNCS